MRKETKEIIEILYDYLNDIYNEIDLSMIETRAGYAYTKGFECGAETILLLIKESINRDE